MPTETTSTDGPIENGPTDMIEALADTWASIDGKLERFRANRTDRSLDLTDGSYPGYMYEAGEMIVRLRRRGFVIISDEAAP